MMVCLMWCQLMCFGILFYVKYSDDVISDDFYMIFDNIFDDICVSNVVYDYLMDFCYFEIVVEVEIELWIEFDDILGVCKVLFCYCVMVYIVGIFLVVFVCVVMLFKYVVGM